MSILISLFKNLPLVFLYGWPFIILIGLFVLRWKWKRYPLEAVIIEKRGNNLIKTNDRLGKKYDKYAELHYYQFLKTKDTIPITNYDWIMHSVFVHTNLFERFINLLRPTTGTIFLFKYGSKQYKPIKIKESESEESQTRIELIEQKDEQGDPIVTYQYIHFDPRNMMGILDFEVIDWDNINFMIQEQRASIIRRQKKGEFISKYLLPILIIGASVVVAIFILKFSFDAGARLQSNQAPAGKSGGSVIGKAIGDAVTPGS